MQFQESPRATASRRPQKIAAAFVAVALAVGLAPQFAAPAQAATDSGSNTFTVQASPVELSTQAGTGSSSGSGVFLVGKGAKAAWVKVKSKSARTVTYLGSGVYANTKVIVPDTVKVGKKTYKVTGINSYAFYYNSNVSNLTIGKNVKTVGKNACGNADKLKKVTLKSSSLKQASIKNLLKGSKIKTIKLSGVSKSAKKNYKKWAKPYKVTVK